MLLTWKGLLVSYCYCSRAIAIACPCASPLQKVLLYIFCHFCPTQPIPRPRDGKFFYCEESVTGAKVDPWLGCYGCLLSIASFANHLIHLMAPTLQRSIDKLIPDKINNAFSLFHP